MAGKTCAIMQPTYLPWLGYFDLLDQVDVFVFLDDVKLEKQSWQVRNRIKSANKEQMLTIPALSVNGMNTMINVAKVDDRSNWRKKHVKTVEQSYAKAPFKEEIVSEYITMLSEQSNFLADITIAVTKGISDKLGIDTCMLKSSNLKESDRYKDDRIVEICTELDCSRYISPVGAKEYINRKQVGGAFADSNIELRYMNYTHPTYRQLGDSFVSYLSILDLLFNHGFRDRKSVV